MCNRLSVMEVVKIIEATQGTTKAMLTLMYLHCLRSTEVTGLQIEDVDFKKCVFTIKRKRGSGVTFPIIPPLQAMLKKEIGKRRSGLVFISRNGGPVRDLRTRLNIAMGAACITKTVSLNDLRHACFRHVLESDPDLPFVYLCTRDHKNTRLYQHIDSKQISNSIKFLRNPCERKRNIF